MGKRHNVFISYHHQLDLRIKREFVQLMGSKIVDMSVDTGDIDVNGRPVEAVRQEIRDDFLAPASVTVVLIGACTWKRKHVDWEIGASLMFTEKNPRAGLLGILLPNHPEYRREMPNLHLVPPRLADNNGGNDSYALIQNWPDPWDADVVQDWIHRAFLRRKRQPDPSNGRHPFGGNWKGKCSKGWQS